MATRTRFLPTEIGLRWASIPFSSHWDTTTSAVRRSLDVDGAACDMLPWQNSTAIAETTASRQSKLLVQFQSGRDLAAQTIAGTLKGQLQCMESDAAADFALQVHVRVVNPATGTDRGVLWAPDKTFTAVGAAGTESYEMATSKTNRKAPQGWSGSGVSLSSVDAQDGDILVVEVGYRHCNTVTTSYTGTVYYGGAASLDLPEDETHTTTGTGWLEFSQTLLWEEPVIQPFTEFELDQELVIIGAKPAVGQLWPRGAGRQ